MVNRHSTAPQTARTTQEIDAASAPKKLEQSTDSSRFVSSLVRDTYNLLFRHLPDQVIVFDNGGYIVEATPLACAELGYSQEEILQLNFGSILPGEEAELLNEVLGKRTSEVYETRTEYVCKNGARKPVEVRFCQIALGAVKVTICSARSILDQLESRQKLEKTCEEMQRLERLRAQYLSCIVHDLRTPLTALKGFVDILLSGKTGRLNERQTGFLESCAVAVERENELIESIYHYSEARLGKFVSDKEHIDLNEILGFSIALFEPLAELKHIRLEADLENQPIVAKGDATALIRVFNNLLSNAIKYNRPDGQIRIAAKRHGDEKVCISIKDTGVGIPKEEIGKIFDRYYRGATSMKSDVPGTGIGLSVVKEIVGLHGGEILVESEPDVGSTFYLTFNLVENS
ncbi:MAG: PAS domain-containing sensor histidine kinase [Pseudomonadota bacterium]